eukprot:1153435-Pelagomonas_calceolata.AAC.5
MSTEHSKEQSIYNQLPARSDSRSYPLPLSRARTCRNDPSNINMLFKTSGNRNVRDGCEAKCAHAAPGGLVHIPRFSLMDGQSSCIFEGSPSPC